MKALIRCRCTGWSAPLLFAYGINRFSHDVAHIISQPNRTKLHMAQWIFLFFFPVNLKLTCGLPWCVTLFIHCDTSSFQIDSLGEAIIDYLGEAFLMSTHNISFYGELSQIIPKLSSNTPLICSSETAFTGFVFISSSELYLAKKSIWILFKILFFRTETIWAASSEFGTYRLCEQRRFRRACASAQSRQNLRCSLIQAVSQEEPSDRKPDP